MLSASDTLELLYREVVGKLRARGCATQFCKSFCVAMTTGDKPEQLCREAAEELRRMGCDTTMFMLL